MTLSLKAGFCMAISTWQRSLEKNGSKWNENVDLKSIWTQKATFSFIFSHAWDFQSFLISPVRPSWLGISAAETQSSSRGSSWTELSSSAPPCPWPAPQSSSASSRPPAVRLSDLAAGPPWTFPTSPGWLAAL